MINELKQKLKELKKEKSDSLQQWNLDNQELFERIDDCKEEYHSTIFKHYGVKPGDVISVSSDASSSSMPDGIFYSDEPFAVRIKGLADYGEHQRLVVTLYADSDPYTYTISFDHILRVIKKG